MRLLLEFLLLLLLAFLGWRQPFRDQVSARLPKSDIAPSRLAVLTEEAQTAAAAPPSVRAPSAPPDSQWMWQPKSLDPRKK